MKHGEQIFSLKGKTALVTGAVGHLGSAMALILAEAGAHVLINSRSKVRADVLVKQLSERGHSVEPAIFDITDWKAVNKFFENHKNLQLHVLINNAYFGGPGSLEFSEKKDFTDSYDVAVGAVHDLLIAALPSLRRAVKAHSDASVINITSMYAMVSPDLRIYPSLAGANPPFYGAAKAALLQLTRYAACEFGGEGVRFNSISPGPFPSNSVQRDSPGFIEKLAARVPLGRIGQADEIKGPTLFLASAASSFVNGANIVVDGGWTAW